MQGWTSYILGIVFAGLGGLSYSYGALNGTTMVLAAFSLVMLYRGANGRDIATADEVIAPMEFIQNPTGALVDAAVDSVGELLSNKGERDGGMVGTAMDKLEEFLSPPGEKAARTSPFDPDAAIERYLANRAEPLPESAPAPSRGQFGRKGL